MNAELDVAEWAAARNAQLRITGSRSQLYRCGICEALHLRIWNIDLLEKLGAVRPPYEDHWRPSSGYRTKNGKSKWRCWNEARMPKEFETVNGRTWLCNSYESAQRKCAELNEAGQ